MFKINLICGFMIWCFSIVFFDIVKFFWCNLIDILFIDKLKFFWLSKGVCFMKKGYN